MGVYILELDMGRPQQNLHALLERANRSAQNAFWGGDCDSAEGLKKACFTAQRCVQLGANPPQGRFSFRDSDEAIIIFKSGRFAGALQGDWQFRALFIYNVCVVADMRGHGVGKMLFMQLGALFPHTTFTLTVFVPRNAPPSLALNETRARVRQLLTMYACLGFRKTRYEDPMVHMKCKRLTATKPDRLAVFM